MPPLSALYVNVYAKRRWWTPVAFEIGASFVALVGAFSDRGADWLARGLIWLCVRFGYVVEVRR